MTIIREREDRYASIIQLAFCMN